MHEWLRAVVAAPNRDALPVEDLADVVRMHPGHVEGDDARAPVDGRTVGLDPLELVQASERVFGQLVLVALDRLQPDGVQIVDRGPEPHGLCDRPRARLELVRQLTPGRLLDVDGADHVPAEVEGGHRL